MHHTALTPCAPSAAPSLVVVRRVSPAQYRRPLPRVASFARRQDQRIVTTEPSDLATAALPLDRRASCDGRGCISIAAPMPMLRHAQASSRSHQQSPRHQPVPMRQQSPPSSKTRRQLLRSRHLQGLQPRHCQRLQCCQRRQSNHPRCLTDRHRRIQRRLQRHRD